MLPHHRALTIAWGRPGAGTSVSRVNALVHRTGRTFGDGTLRDDSGRVPACGACRAAGCGWRGHAARVCTPSIAAALDFGDGGARRAEGE
eukprot:3360824-Prymnesium_polylepis.1